MPSLSDYQAQSADASDEPTLQATGGVVAPLAAGVIASLTVIKSGWYKITTLTGYGATSDVMDNFDLAIGGVQVYTLPAISAPNLARPELTIRARALAGQVIAVRAIAAGAVGSVYRATVIAERMLD